MPLVVKGILHPEDAEIALNMKVAAIIISNHGGRQLDGVPATIEILPEIAKRIDSNVPLLLDGGFRRGSDVFKAGAFQKSRPCLTTFVQQNNDGN